jgi:hypothetical protein
MAVQHAASGPASSSSLAGPMFHEFSERREDLLTVGDGRAALVEEIGGLEKVVAARGRHWLRKVALRAPRIAQALRHHTERL